MINPEEQQFNPGGIPDRFDNRDYQWSEIGHASVPFDWNAGFDIETNLGVKIPIKDQGLSSSCGGQAWAYLAEVIEALATKSFEERSAKYIYAQTYVPGGGSMGRDNAEIFVRQGVARETALSSYENAMPPTETFMERGQDVTDPAREDAKLDRSSAYSNVAIDPESLATAMRDNNGVIILITGSQNGTWLSEFPHMPSPGENMWRHWVLLCKAKLINGKKFFGFPNSWGLSAGNQGWQWISEDYVNSGNILQGWTHVFNPNPPPVFTHQFLVDIKYGDNGPEVVALQKVLQIDGEFPSTVPTTGFYADITRRAVLAFRVKYGISSSTDPLGKSVGPLTRAKLNSL